MNVAMNIEKLKYIYNKVKIKMHDLEIGEIIGDFYEIRKPLSQGSFGKVYLGKNIENGMKVAIKVEKPEM